MTDEVLAPHTPLIASADLPGIGGQIGPNPEDFVVEEMSAYEPSGAGEHLYVRVKKTSLTTPECIGIIARASGVREREIGSAGMKDKHAVTTQWLSLPARGTPAPETWKLPSTIEIVQVSKHNNKLRTGHLSKNTFRIRLVGVDADAAPKAQAITTHISKQGLLNYFGTQRFGRQGNNWNAALRWITGNPERAGRFHKKLYPSVIQSEIFNRYLTQRYGLGLGHLLQGEVVRLGTGHSLFCVQDLAAEQARYTAGELHLMGPIVGPKMKRAEADALALEQRIINEVDLSDEILQKLGEFGPGTRRDLIVFPESLSIEATAPPSPNAIILTFSLPPGSYATQLIGEYTRDFSPKVAASEARPDAVQSAAAPPE